MTRKDAFFIAVELVLLAAVITTLFLSRKFCSNLLLSLVVLGLFVLQLIVCYRFFTTRWVFSKDGKDERSPEPWD